jgi:ribonuclease J
VIPGNEAAVLGVVSNLLRRGVDLRTWWSDRSVHVSGHAHRQEQRRMIELVRPRAFVPLHGTLHHLSRHAALARELGVPEVCLLENGDVGALGASSLDKSARVRAGRVHVAGGRVIARSVLHERAALASCGVAHVAVPVDARGRLAGEISLAMRGVVEEAGDGNLVESARGEARAAIEALLAGTGSPDSSAEEIAETVRRVVRRAVARRLGFKPVTTVSIVRVQP